MPNNNHNNQPPVQNNSNSNDTTALLTQLQPLLTALQTINGNQQSTSSNPPRNTLLVTKQYNANEKKRPKMRHNDDDTMEDEPLSDNAGPSKTNESILPLSMQEVPIPIKTAELEKKQKKKKGKAVLPVLANQSSAYDILEDLVDAQAKISFGQLIRTSPEQRLKLSKGLRKPMRPKRIPKRKTMIGQKLRTTSAWCEAKIGTVPIDLILDTGASGCVVSHEFLKKWNIKIQRKSEVAMTDITGTVNHPLGAIDNFPITVDKLTIPADVDVTASSNL